MPDMLHMVRIRGTADRVYEALTTQSGLSRWWTRLATARPVEGSRARFEFGVDTGFTMRVAKLEPSRSVVWDCEGDHEEWRGTRLTWEIVPGDGECELHLVHAGWERTGGWFAECNTTWGELLYRLKADVEGGEPGPLFPLA